MIHSQTLFSSDNTLFLNRMFEKFPSLRERFDYFEQLNSGEGPDAAWAALASLPRTGYVRVGIPAEQVQTVQEHCTALLDLGRRFRHMPPLVKPDHLLAMLRVHDLPEAVVGDFAPGDLEPAEKGRLEHLAAKVIFQDPAHQDKLRLWEEFEGIAPDGRALDKKSATATFANDLDRLEMLERCVAYEKSFPDLGGVIETQFWKRSGVPEKFVTPQARLHLSEIRSALEQWRVNPDASQQVASHLNSDLGRN